MKKIYLIQMVIAFASLFSCTYTAHRSSRVQGLSANESRGNVALLFQTNFAPSQVDLSILNEILADEKTHYGFQVETKQDSTKEDILSIITERASSVGPDGTLFLYIGGHGSPNGYLQTFDGDFINFVSVKEAIKRGRTKPFRRLVMFVFSCYSGNWITGDNPVALMNSNMSNELTSADGDVGLYREVIVMTSSNATEESWGGGTGTEFANSVSRSFSSLTRPGSSPTIKQFLDQIVWGVSSSTPLYNTIPKSLLSEPLLNTPSTNPPTGDVSYAVALGQPNPDQSSILYVATEQRVQNVSICAGELSKCSNNTYAAEALTPSAKAISGRNVFQTSTAINLMPGLMSLKLYSVSGELIGTKQFRVTRK